MIVYTFAIIVLASIGMLLALRTSPFNRIKRKPISCNVCMGFWFGLINNILLNLLPQISKHLFECYYILLKAFAVIPFVALFMEIKALIERKNIDEMIKQIIDEDEE